MNASANSAAMPPAITPNVTSVASPAMGGGAKRKAPVVKKLLCGRERVVSKEGRSSFVVINGHKYTMTEAKAYDAAWRKEKKDKEAAKKAKATAKKAKAAKTTRKPKA